jgi:hypothetical protein
MHANLNWNTRRKEPGERPRGKLENNIKMDFRDIRCEDMD